MLRMETLGNAENVKTVYVGVYDDWADWEVGYAIAHIGKAQWQREPGRYRIRTVGRSLEPVLTMGGVRVVPDVAADEVEVEDAAMLILAGSGRWDVDPEFAEFGGRLARRFVDAGVPVAAICGATSGLARAGLLDDRDHTSAAAYYLAATGYQGGERYREADAVSGDGVITAGPTEPVAFAREVFATLDLYEPEVLDAWFRLFALSDASAFPVLMAAGA
jgi:putative intracellular protease/amidase